jgi:hypothetical protein
MHYQKYYGHIRLHTKKKTILRTSPFTLTCDHNVMLSIELIV